MVQTQGVSWPVWSWFLSTKTEIKVGEDGWGETHLLCVKEWRRKTIHLFRASAFTQVQQGCQCLPPVGNWHPVPWGPLENRVDSPHHFPTEEWESWSIYSPTSVTPRLKVAPRELTSNASSQPPSSRPEHGLMTGEAPWAERCRRPSAEMGPLQVSCRAGQRMGTSNVSTSISASSTAVGQRPDPLRRLVTRIHHVFQILLQSLNISKHLALFR